MVTGKLPFEGERQEAVLYAIANEDPEPITALRAGVPMELEWIVGKAMAKAPEERYQHVDELIVRIRHIDFYRMRGILGHVAACPGQSGKRPVATCCISLLAGILPPGIELSRSFHVGDVAAIGRWIRPSIQSQLMGLGRWKNV